MGTTTLGENEQSSIILNQNGASTLALRGDINLAASATGGSLISSIENTSTTATLIIGGDINGYSTPGVAAGGGIDLRINSTGSVIFNTTGGAVTDTNAQTFNVDDFGVGNSGANNDFATATLGTGKVVNADVLNVGVNFTLATSAGDRNVSGDLTIDDTTVTTLGNTIVGAVTNTIAAGGTDDRTGVGIVTLDNGGTLAVGSALMVGNGAGSTAAANQTAEGTVNVNGASTVTVVGDIDLGATDNTMGTLNINSGSVSTSGNVNVGGDFSSSNADAGSVGELNIATGGTLTISDTGGEQHLFIGRDGMGTVTSAGTVNITNGDVRLGDSSVATGETNTLNVTGGTFNVSEQVVAGMTPGNTGIINVTGGTLVAGEEIYLGGNATNNVDAGSSGTLNIGPAGTVVVNDGAFTTNQNVEVGRDAAGFLDVDGGTLNIHTGNLVFGQTNTVVNDARGTGTFQNGATINVGDTFVDGMDTDGQQNDLNFNAGGGDITHSGAGTTVRIERDLNMQSSNAVAATNNSSTYTISDTSTLEIGRDLNSRINVGGSNTFTIVGGETNVDIARDLDIDQASSTLVFDFDSTSDLIYDFNLDVGEDAEVGNATLTFANSADLSTFTGDILLIDVEGVSSSGQFANAAEGTVFGAYQITYLYADTGGTQGAGIDQGLIGGGQSIALVRAAVAVPEPSSLAFLATCCCVVMTRRRRRS